jgi:hypothetical protein
MSLHKVQNIFIGDGTALPSANTNATPTTIASGDLAIVGVDNKTLSAGDTVSDSDEIRIFQGLASGFKISPVIPGRGITNVNAENYAAAKRTVWSIGYSRSTATGSITVNSDTLYQFGVIFKNEKNLFSERPLRFSLSFQSAVTATQSLIATQIANAINNNASLPVNITAVKVGDGTGVAGLTGASNFGVEITGNILTQFSTEYWENRVDFDVFVDSTSGFVATPFAVIERKSYGTGTYQQIYNIENFDFGYEGVLNRRLFPFPTLTYAANATLVGTTIVPTATMTTLEDKITFSATVVGMLASGDQITIGGVAFEIKYFISSTVAIATAVNTGSTLTTQAVVKKVGYDMINIEFRNRHNGGGADVLVDSQQSIVIAVPAGIAGSAYTVNSLQADDLLGVLNPYINSLGFASVTV